MTPIIEIKFDLVDRGPVHYMRLITIEDVLLEHNNTNLVLQLGPHCCYCSSFEQSSQRSIIVLSGA